MKYVFLLICLLVSSACFSAEPTYDEAINLAEKSNKKVLLYFGTEWCGYCKKMKTLFEDKDVGDRLDKFVFLKLDADKETHLKKKFSVKAIPDYMIIDKDNNIIKRNKGYLNKDSFMKWLED